LVGGSRVRFEIIALNDSVRGRRSFTLAFYELRGRRFERSFESGTFRYPDARFVEEAANQIAIRTFMLPPPPSRGHRESEDEVAAVSWHASWQWMVWEEMQRKVRRRCRTPPASA